MSELIPVSRKSMHTLKAKYDEKNRQMRVKDFVQDIYKRTIQAAQTKTGTSFQYDIPTELSKISPFHLANMKEIIGELETLFPDCSVKYVKLTAGHNGIYYDLSNPDEKLRPICRVRGDDNKGVIIIDWS